MRISGQHSINRNILECKETWHPCMNTQMAVLIETYWNVKELPRKNWKLSESCINRNILECKDVLGCPGNRGNDVLIETYWNVKIKGSQIIYAGFSY